MTLAATPVSKKTLMAAPLHLAFTAMATKGVDGDGANRTHSTVLAVAELRHGSSCAIRHRQIRLTPFVSL